MIREREREFQHARDPTATAGGAGVNRLGRRRVQHKNGMEEGTEVLSLGQSLDFTIESKLPIYCVL